jgi:steroid delta-isomerase-like uncharacterized protein
VAAFQHHDPEAAAALYHDDATNFQVATGAPDVGRAAIFESLRGFFVAFPDSFTDVENLFEDGEWAMLEWSGGGTWRGPFAGLSPNGRTFRLRGCGFFHVVAGRIKFQRGYWDKAAWFRQLDIPIEEGRPRRHRPR